MGCKLARVKLPRASKELDFQALFGVAAGRVDGPTLARLDVFQPTHPRTPLGMGSNPEPVSPLLPKHPLYAPP